MSIAFRSNRIVGAAVLVATLVISVDAGAQASRGPAGPSGPGTGAAAGRVASRQFPLPNIELQVRGPGTRPIPPMRTNARGEFSVQLEEGEYRITTSGRKLGDVVKSLDCCPGDVNGDGKDDLNVGIALTHPEYSTGRDGPSGSGGTIKVNFQDLLISSIHIPKGGGTFAGRLWAIGRPGK